MSHPRAMMYAEGEISMYSNVEGFALLWIAASVESERRARHAARVVAKLDLDPRMAEFIPLEPRRRTYRAQYERLLDSLVAVSAQPEPQRTRDIEQLRVLAARHRGKS